MPVLYPEDEHFLVSQMQPLIGKANPNLTNIIDFSVHAARIFNLHGFTGIDDRVAIAVLQRYEGIYMLDYLQKEWIHLNNDGFRALLHQIMTGLLGLHGADGAVELEAVELAAAPAAGLAAASAVAAGAI